MEKLKDFIRLVLECFDGYSENVDLSFELNVDENLNVNNIGPHKIKFSCKNK